MARRMRVKGDGGSWDAELDGGGVVLSELAGAFAVEDEGDGRFVVRGPGAERRAIAMAGAGDVVWVGIDGQVFEFHVGQDAAGGAKTDSPDQDALSPPMSATVVRIAVQPGAVVQAGDTLIVLEAMKMELPIRAPRAGTVRAIHCQEGDLVQPGVILVEL
jgi:3-methylcrotonyl-CoA carboxylase alpha subunit